MAIKFGQPVTIEQPQQPGMIEPRKGPFAITAEQVQRSPAQRGSLIGPAGIEETSYTGFRLSPDMVE
jgi:hypothetical protein